MGGIRDVTSSFKIAFIIGGISFLISAAFHFALRTSMPADENDFDELDEIREDFSVEPQSENKKTTLDV